MNFDLTPPPFRTPRVYELPANPYVPEPCNPPPPPIVPPRRIQRSPIPPPSELSWESLSSDEKPEADLALGFKIWSQGSREKLEKQLKKGCKNEKVKEVLDILKNSASKFKQHSSLFESPILECLKAPSEKRNKCLLGLVIAMQEEGHKLKSIGKSTRDTVLTKLLSIRRTSTFQQQVNALNFLLKQGPRSLVNKRDAQGCSPLDYAVLSGNAGAVALLLQHQADPMSQNRSQKSARDIAMESASRLTQGGSELMINNHAHIMSLLFRDGQSCHEAVLLYEVGLFQALLASIGISMGGLLYGLDTGIIATTIGQSTFKTYMYGGSQGPPALVGGIVASYYAGGCIGGLQSGWLMDKWSRRYTVLIGAVVSILGAALQAAAVNPGMMIAGRIFSGWSTGVLYSVTPIYLAEISAPENRGFLVGLKGLTNAGGFFVANWIGYAGSFASGNVQWRIPLAMQAPPAVGLGLLVFAMPFSPRWLVKQERHEDAIKVLRRLHGARGEDFVQRQYVEIRDQLALEADLRRQSSLKILFTRQYARRMLLACLIVNMTKLSGSQVIQNYQSLMYTALGFKGQTVLLIAGCYATLAILLALSKYYPDDRNLAGSSAGVAFIFIFSFLYAVFFNSTNWVLVSEIFPLHLRGTGVGFAIFTQAVTAIWLSQVSPTAFEALEWKFYFIFIATNVSAGLVYYFFLPETNQLSLEQIAAVFGDAAVEGNLRQKDTIDDKTEAIELEEERK
ncbi:hypothetical protein K4K59_005735 [Colletotrichum sp. SAR11_240]|nr:hypothetical protein K4K59_005735 [Colletotrichum sp. SAR11_240]